MTFTQRAGRNSYSIVAISRQ